MSHLITSEASYFPEIFGWLADAGFTTLTSFHWVSVSNLIQPFPREYRSEGSLRSKSPPLVGLFWWSRDPISLLGWLARCLTTASDSSLKLLGFKFLICVSSHLGSRHKVTSISMVASLSSGNDDNHCWKCCRCLDSQVSGLVESKGVSNVLLLKVLVVIWYSLSNSALTAS